jgi:hypothetical protein
MIRLSEIPMAIAEKTGEKPPSYAHLWSLIIAGKLSAIRGPNGRWLADRDIVIEQLKRLPPRRRYNTQFSK